MLKLSTQMVKKLMEVDGSMNFFKIAIEDTMSFAKNLMSPEEFQAFIIEILNEVNVPKKMATVYKEYYEADDILALISFFKSSTGKKLLRLQPQMLPKVSINTQLIAAEMMVVALRKVAERYPNAAGLSASDGPPRLDAIPPWEIKDEEEDEDEDEGQNI
jgi:hypothetical protein